eukprot:TRINITY_DN24601_c0_g2_i1.p2 TRINITY_DN24601_c0_g2~~TRINITY_DN24601_c0_g2_i1.p2  ORF type:complete len:234 (+),score=73.11 TRINITY_DN24601_c0_g2_i1:273-974(+)
MADVTMLQRGLKAKIEAGEEERPQKAPKKEGGKGGKAARGGGKKTDVDQIITQLAKLTLATARKTATLEACVLQSVIFNKEDVIATTAKQTAQDYGKMVKEVEPKEREKCGSPHLYIWQECVRAMANTGNLVATEYLKKTKEEASKAVEPDEIPSGMRDIYAENVKAFRVTKTWNPQMVRMQTGIEKGTSEHNVLKALTNYLCEKAKGVRKSGAPPKSDAERRVQKLLEQMAD